LEPPPPIWRRLGRCGRLDRQHRGQQVADRPNPIRDAERDRWRCPQCFVHAAHVAPSPLWETKQLSLEFADDEDVDTGNGL